MNIITYEKKNSQNYVFLFLKSDQKESKWKYWNIRQSSETDFHLTVLPSTCYTSAIFLQIFP